MATTESLKRIDQLGILQIGCYHMIWIVNYKDCLDIWKHSKMYNWMKIFRNLFYLGIRQKLLFINTIFYLF